MSEPLKANVDSVPVVVPVRQTHARWFPILALIAFGTMLNYLDRTVLGIAAPSLTKDLGLTAAMMGVAFSAFSWSYALLQIPGGIFLDRFGTRVTYFVALFGWSLFTALMAVCLGGLLIVATIVYALHDCQKACSPGPQPAQKR